VTTDLSAKSPPAFESPIIQVAGIIDYAEAAMLQECGIRYLGFPLRLPVNREDLTEVEAAAIIRSLRPPARGVLITYLDEAEAIAEFCRALGVRNVQLHGDISQAELARLRRSDPSLTIVKSLVIGRHPIPVLERAVAQLGPYVDAFLTDTYSPETGASGATGRTHDWAVSRRLVELSPRPVVLAGGLTPANVGQAMVAVRPAGVDVHTGVEDASGRKSREKVLDFMAEVMAGFQARTTH
jgi:phosphoribosylanthranilate isomerase